MNPVDTIRAAILQEIDWGAVYRRLRYFAFRLAREMPAVFNGISADDLVGETLTTFFADPDGLSWTPTTRQDLERFLCAILKNKFMTHQRRSRNREVIAENRIGPGLHIATPSRDMITERIKVVAQGKPDLEELVDASQHIDDEGNINQQLSVQLDTTVQDVINRRKRLIRGLKKANLSGRNYKHRITLD